MDTGYRPHTIANERGVYLITCKKDFAEQLTEFLNHEGVIATLTANETTESMEGSDKSEPYAVSQIDLATPLDTGIAKELISRWCQSRFL